MSRICRIIVLFGDKSAWDCREPVNFLLHLQSPPKVGRAPNNDEKIAADGLHGDTLLFVLT